MPPAKAPGYACSVYACVYIRPIGFLVGFYVSFSFKNILSKSNVLAFLLAAAIKRIQRRAYRPVGSSLLQRAAMRYLAPTIIRGGGISLP